MSSVVPSSGLHADRVAHSPDEPATWRLVALALPAIPTYALMLAFAMYVPAYTTETLGIDLAVAGVLFMVARLLGAVLDPAVGRWSDRTTSRLGKRKPWVIGGTVLGLLAMPLVFFPNPLSHSSTLAVALGVIALTATMTVVQTPLTAWAGDASRQYHGRTRAQAAIAFASAIGVLIAQLIPALVDQVEVFRNVGRVPALGIVITALLLLSLYTSAVVPDRSNERATRGHSPRSESLRAALTSISRDRILLRVIGSDFFVSLGQGIRTALFIFFVTFYMDLPHWGPALFLLQTLFGLLVAPLWQRIGQRLGKQRTVLIAEGIQIAINLLLLLLAPRSVGLLIALTVAQGLTQGSGNLMLRAIVADVAELHRLRWGTERGGMLFSIFNVTMNAAAATAIGLVFPLLAYLGFQPHGANPSSALNSLHWLFALGPAFGHAVSAALVWGLPVDEHSFAQQRAALSRRHSTDDFTGVTQS
ncbi:MAG: MFS transporter [Steroidobacteraceae bacterium]